MTASAAVVTGQGTAVPPAMDQVGVWDDAFSARLGGDKVARRIFLGCGVTTRHAVVDPRETDVSTWTTGERMERFVTDSRPLARDAVAKALAAAGLAASDVGLFVVVSCTGYATPGLDIMVARDLGMAPDVRRLMIGHMGCYAAIPALGTAADFVRARGLPAVVVCVELPSLHVQPSTGGRDLEQLVSHALFADAASAVVLEPDAPHGLEVLDTAAVTDPSSAELMTWQVTDHGFRMGLSPKVPDVLSLHVLDATKALLTPFSLTVDDIAGWAVHPGGPRIIDVVVERLGLDRSCVDPTRAVLDRYGNCSSATVLLVLDQIRRDQTLEAGAPVVGMAFGPGLTLCTVLLRQR